MYLQNICKHALQQDEVYSPQNIADISYVSFPPNSNLTEKKLQMLTRGLSLDKYRNFWFDLLAMINTHTRQRLGIVIICFD